MAARANKIRRSAFWRSARACKAPTSSAPARKASCPNSIARSSATPATNRLASIGISTGWKGSGNGQASRSSGARSAICARMPSTFGRTVSRATGSGGRRSLSTSRTRTARAVRFAGNARRPTRSSRWSASYASAARAPARPAGPARGPHRAMDRHQCRRGDALQLPRHLQIRNRCMATVALWREPADQEADMGTVALEISRLPIVPLGLLQ